MLCAPLVDGPALLWVAIEITTVVSALLVAIDRTRSASEAAWKYVLIASAGLGIGLFATLVLYYAGAQLYGTSYELNLSQMIAAGHRLPAIPARLAFVLALLGYGTKVGLVPVHTWLPDAHSEAPTPISAMLSGSLLVVSFYAVLRYVQVTSPTLGGGFDRTVLILFGVASLLVAALSLLRQQDVKRLLAYSSVEHMGILCLGVGFGVALAAGCLALAALTPLEIQLVAHGLTGLVPAAVTTQASGPNWVLGPVYPHFSVLSPSWLTIELPTAAILVLLLGWWASAGRLFRIRGVPAWRSATSGVTGQDRYTPFGYANPTRRVLASVLLTRSRIQALEHIPNHARTDIDPQADDHPTARLGYTVDVIELVDRFGYRPLVTPLRALATATTRLQSGRLDAYLTYILITLVALLAVVTAMS